jgi:hypothetical protein
VKKYITLSGLKGHCSVFVYVILFSKHPEQKSDFVLIYLYEVKVNNKDLSVKVQFNINTALLDTLRGLITDNCAHLFWEMFVKDQSLT